MDILIVDDEPLARARVMKLLQDIPDCHVVGEATTGDEALAQIQQVDPDLVLLDIRMPGPSGMEVAQKIAEIEDPPAIIFCSAYDQYALEAFDVKAVGYLLKPLRLQQLQEAIENAKKLNRLQKVSETHAPQEAERAHITAKTHRGVELIEIDAIRFFSADQKYVTVIHTGGQTLIDQTLKDLEVNFGDSFIRVHRNALVAKKFIIALEKAPEKGYQLCLQDCEIKPVVSRRHLTSVKDLMQRL